MDIEKKLEIEEKIKQILISDLDIKAETIENSKSDTALLGRGIGIDSMETLVLVAGIEREFDIEVSDDDLTVDLFKTLGSLEEFILKQMNK